MVRARAESQWAQTSNLMAVIVNANPFRSGEPVKASDFNPYADKKTTGPVMTVSVSELWELTGELPAGTRG